jgi:hypothetical protein
MKYALAMAAAVFLAWTAVAGDASAADAGSTVNSHTLFLNNCQPNGCVVTRGQTNATTDRSDIAQGTVTAFNQSASIWTSVVSCMQTVMSPFDLTVTDQRPASGDYFEIMIAGTSTDVGGSSDVGAYADAQCSAPGTCDGPYRPDALVFAFANESYYANKPNVICGTAAQAIALTWTLDHVVDASDVMSYNAYSGVQAFHDGEARSSVRLSRRLRSTGARSTGPPTTEAPMGPRSSMAPRPWKAATARRPATMAVRPRTAG